MKTIKLALKYIVFVIISCLELKEIYLVQIQRENVKLCVKNVKI